jgi:cell division protein ZapE
MYGGVGRGKSFLMDCFFNAVPIKRKTRLHFHEFMREVHRELRAAGHGQPAGRAGPAHGAALQADLLRRVPRRRHHRRHDPAPPAGAVRQRRGLCHHLQLQPDELYPDGLHRDRILPAIDLLNERMEVINVDTAPTTAAHAGAGQALPHPAGRRGRRGHGGGLRAAGRGPDEDPVLHIEAREIRAPARRRRGVVRLPHLCGGPRSQNDYLEIASQFHTVLLSDVPHMPVRMASEARRFTWLVDVLYDRRVKLILSAAVARAAVHRGPAGARVSAHRLAPERDAVGRIPGRTRRTVDTHLT